MREKILFGLSAAVICLALASGVHASSIDSQAFTDIGAPMANGSPTGNINTATTFTIGNFVSTASNTGIFAGMPTQFFPSFTFNITSPTSLAFGNSVFGTFASTAITVVTNTPGFLNLSVTGEWTPGTFGGVTGGPFASSLTFTFTQTPSHSGAIGASAVFETIVPEPPSVVMGLTGLAIGGVIYGFRRRRRATLVLA